MKTIDELLPDWLRRAGYEGLCNDDDCACSLDDLRPCGECGCSCTPAHKVKAPQNSDADYWMKPGRRRGYRDGK